MEQVVTVIIQLLLLKTTKLVAASLC